jgi:hypothetical protein
MSHQPPLILDDPLAWRWYYYYLFLMIKLALLSTHNTTPHALADLAICGFSFTRERMVMVVVVVVGACCSEIS